MPMQPLKFTGQKQDISTYAIYAINILLVVTAAYIFADMILKIWFTPPEPEPGNFSANWQGEVTRSSKQGFRPVALFGKAEVKRTIPVERPKPVKANLNYKLFGTIKGNHKNVALIAKSSAKPKSYVEGEEIESGVRLEEVAIKYVILRHNGQRQRLELESKSKGGGVLNIDNNIDHNMDYNIDGNIDNIHLPLGERAVNYKEQFAKNPMNLSHLVQGAPVMQNGKLRGFRVNPGSDPEMFRDLGFQPEDVITEIENVKLDNIAELGKIVSRFDNLKNVRVKFIRGGIEQQMMVDMNKYQQ